MIFVTPAVGAGRPLQGTYEMRRNTLADAGSFVGGGIALVRWLAFADAWFLSLDRWLLFRFAVGGLSQYLAGVGVASPCQPLWLPCWLQAVDKVGLKVCVSGHSVKERSGSAKVRYQRKSTWFWMECGGALLGHRLSGFSRAGEKAQGHITDLPRLLRQKSVS